MISPWARWVTRGVKPPRRVQILAGERAVDDGPMPIAEALVLGAPNQSFLSVSHAQPFRRSHVARRIVLPIPNCSPHVSVGSWLPCGTDANGDQCSVMK